MEKMKEYPINFSEIKRNIKIEDIVSHFRLKFRQTKSWQLQGQCCLKNHPGDRDSGSFAINTDKQIYVCNTGCEPSSGVGSLDFYCDFMGYDRQADIYKAAKELLEIFKCENFEVRQRNHNPIKPVKEKKYNPKNTIHLDVEQNVDYLLKTKKLHPKTIKYFQIGKAKYGVLKDHMVVPVHSSLHGYRIGYAGQNIESGKWQFRFKKRYELFNFNRTLELLNDKQKLNSLIVVESFWSAMYLHQNGFPNVVALMGAFASDEQIQLIRKITDSVILFLDNDFAGKNGTNQILKKINDVPTSVIDFSKFSGKRKPIDFSKEELKEVLPSKF